MKACAASPREPEKPPLVLRQQPLLKLTTKRSTKITLIVQTIYDPAEIEARHVDNGSILGWGSRPGFTPSS